MAKNLYSKVECLNKLTDEIIDAQNPEEVRVIRNDDGNISEVVYYGSNTKAYKSCTVTYEGLRVKSIHMDYTKDKDDGVFVLEEVVQDTEDS